MMTIFVVFRRGEAEFATWDFQAAKKFKKHVDEVDPESEVFITETVICSPSEVEELWLKS